MVEIEKIKKQSKPEDVVVVYYAGHGVMSEEEIPRFYLALHGVTQLYGDSTTLSKEGISQEELRQISYQIKARKQVFVLDACQSGGMVEALVSRGAAEERAIAQLSRSTGTFWLVASGSEQFAGEIKQLGHGIFTYAILEGIQGKGDNGDKKITIQELGAYLNDRVPELAKQYRQAAQ